MKALRTLAQRTALISLLAVFNSQISTAIAQGTAFTYQGRLNDGANPATGNYDLTFTLYATSSGPGIKAGPVTNTAVTVSNGLFAVTLDFGANFPGNDRWLEIGVRTNGGGGFTTLSPRQAITPTPYAITAANVSGPISGSSILPGTITATDLAAGAAASNLNASGQAGVSSGGIVLSASNNAALASAGYVKIGSTTVGDVWSQRNNGAPSVRGFHTAIWTGTEMIVWGGFGGSALNDGGPL